VYKLDNNRDQLVVNKLTSHFNDAIVMNEVLTDMLCLTVKKESIPTVLFLLRNDIDLQYNFLTTLCGMHDQKNNQLGVVYHLHSFMHNHRIRIKTYTSLNEPTIPTIISIWPAANWMEREAFDFFGIQFEGHPNLKRILNEEDMVAFPMRKDFPLEDQTREDKDDSMFGR
jgi:NADH-quinone oxidoreductase subunit C